MKYNLTCLKCIFLHIHGYGYSDWTWEGDEITCAKGCFNQQEKPYDHEVTESCECKEFIAGEPFETSPDGFIHGGKQVEKCQDCNEGGYDD